MGMSLIAFIISLTPTVQSSSDHGSTWNDSEVWDDNEVWID